MLSRLPADPPELSLGEEVPKWERVRKARQATAIESAARTWVQINPRAVASPDTFWSLILEQMRDGLL